MTIVAVGGTFDRLHLGHKALLSRAFQVGNLILIGLTTDELANATRERKVRSYNSRRKDLLNMIKSEVLGEYQGKTFTIVPISDRYGLTLEKDMDIIVVSRETLDTAREINTLRRERGMSEVQIELIDFVMAKDGEPISATRINRGEIDPDGRIGTEFHESDFPKDLPGKLASTSGKEPLLIHICCAPCLAGPFADLVRDHTPIGFFYNTNIHPYREYRQRLECLREYARDRDLRVIYREHYNPEHFMKNVVRVGLSADKRCSFCYQDRLEETARLAVRLGIRKFTTSLLSSPYQDHDLIRKLGDEIALVHDLEFFYYDHRDGYQQGVKEVRSMQLYVQSYCGCLFSERDRYYKNKSSE